MVTMWKEVIRWPCFLFVCFSVSASFLSVVSLLWVPAALFPPFHARVDFKWERVSHSFVPLVCLAMRLGDISAGFTVKACLLWHCFSNILVDMMSHIFSLVLVSIKISGMEKFRASQIIAVNSVFKLWDSDWVTWRGDGWYAVELVRVLGGFSPPPSDGGHKDFPRWTEASCVGLWTCGYSQNHSKILALLPYLACMSLTLSQRKDFEPWNRNAFFFFSLSFVSGNPKHRLATSLQNLLTLQSQLRCLLDTLTRLIMVLLWFFIDVLTFLPVVIHLIRLDCAVHQP